MSEKNNDFSYIRGTILGDIINRAGNTWGEILGFYDETDRSRHADGTFKGDDTSTPNINEAWKTGKSPKKKSKIVSGDISMFSASQHDK